MLLVVSGGRGMLLVVSGEGGCCLLFQGRGDLLVVQGREDVACCFRGGGCACFRGGGKLLVFSLLSPRLPGSNRVLLVRCPC